MELQQLRSTRRKSTPTKILQKIDQLPANTLVILASMIGCGVLLILLQDLSYNGKVTFIIFLFAMLLWIFSSLSAGFVALGALSAIVLLKASPPSLLYQSFSEEVVWLMIGSFIIGEGVRSSGLASRLSNTVLKKANSSSHILSLLTLALQPLSFFIPSTSGRAALALPVVKELNQLFTNEKQKATLAMLVPVIILIGSSATLIGAGSHIIGIGLLNTSTGEKISYFQWFIWGAPFALVMCGISLFVMRFMFWKNAPLQLQTDVPDKAQPFTAKEKRTLYLISGLILFWMTESIHGYDIAFVTMIGALFFILPNYGIINWKQGINSVSWNLIIFVAAATALGRALVDTGVVDWLQSIVFSKLGFLQSAPSFIVLLIILIISTTSHLFITSHTTRAVVMIPAFLVLSQTLDLNSTAVVFLSLVGMNYCVTFPVSSKALLLFHEDEHVSYPAKDLIKLSLILMPIYVVVMVIFYYTYWRWTGLTL
ncbi:SLC13 family permease [Bacillus sp. JJ722]|uniref:SLC13 family permease n=1 Tax=Bacillus sp. JJ722 TaxID=3122973 RepID=UPI002FFF9A0E